jgi:putative transposase
MRTRSLNHSVYEVQYHLVWGVKYRREILKSYVKPELIRSIERVQKTYPTWYVHEINTEADHVHILIEIPPDVSIAEAVQKIKIRTSRDLRKKFKYIDRIFTKSGIWSVGYYASTVGLNESKIRKYISHQGERGRGEDASDLFS